MGVVCASPLTLGVCHLVTKLSICPPKPKALMVFMELEVQSSRYPGDHSGAWGPITGEAGWLVSGWGRDGKVGMYSQETEIRSFSCLTHATEEPECRILLCDVMHSVFFAILLEVCSQSFNTMKTCFFIVHCKLQVNIP